MKIHLVGAELFHVDGRTDGRTDGGTDGSTDMTKLTVALRNFANAPKQLLPSCSEHSVAAERNRR
jgi:hypothetical protein